MSASADMLTCQIGIDEKVALLQEKITELETTCQKLFQTQSKTEPIQDGEKSKVVNGEGNVEGNEKDVSSTILISHFAWQAKLINGIGRHSCSIVAGRQSSQAEETNS